MDYIEDKNNNREELWEKYKRITPVFYARSLYDRYIQNVRLTEYFVVDAPKTIEEADELVLYLIDVFR